MVLLYAYLASIGVGALTAAAIVGRYVPDARKLSPADQRKWLYRLPPFFGFATEVLNFLRKPVAQLWNTYGHPIVLAVGEKWSRRFRILALKVERLFHRMSDWFRGKRIAIQGNGNPADAIQGKNSQFWSEMQKLKTGEKK